MISIRTDYLLSISNKYRNKEIHIFTDPLKKWMVYIPSTGIKLDWSYFDLFHKLDKRLHIPIRDYPRILARRKIVSKEAAYLSFIIWKDKRDLIVDILAFRKFYQIKKDHVPIDILDLLRERVFPDAHHTIFI